MRLHYVCLFASVLISAASAMAAPLQNVRGELTCDHCTSYHNVVVEISDSTRTPVGNYSVNQNGSFSVDQLSEGNYLMTVRGPNGREITSQSVSVRPNSGPVTIHVPDCPEVSTSPRGGETSVSVYGLSHKIPKAARKEFEKAARAGDDHQAAIQHLEKAIEIDPKYVEALNNLGSRYIRVDRFVDALTVLNRAQDIDPGSAKVQTNLAVALLSIKNVADGERAARRAFQLASNDPKARYILGLALYNKQQFNDETAKLLRDSVDHFPAANIALAWVYAHQGKRKEARGLLNGYLDAGHTDRAGQVRSMLTMLKQD